MTALRPRRPVHRGSVEAAAVLVDPTLLGEEGARRRILDHWAPGARVFRLGDGQLLLRFAAACRLRCDSAPGAPLVAEGSTLSSAPLDDDECEALGAPAGTAVVVRAGVAVLEPLGIEEDPSEWLELGGFEVVEVTALGDQPGPPRAIPPPAADVREVLGPIIPQRAPETVQLLEALQTSGLPRASTGGGGLARAVGVLFGGLARMLEGSGRASSSMRTVGAATAAPREPSGLARWLRRLSEKLLLNSRLAAVLGRQHARYLRRTMAMFESGDLTDALRHAIPLGGAGGGGLALGAPSARSSLEISLERAPGKGLLASGELFEDLRTVYRRAFEKMEREGRLEEAAFILAELLGASEEAVAFLERHGRKRQAAELAEARGLPPGLVVRQWFVAGELRRAVDVARRTGAFADAVLRLERTDGAGADTLRLLWAESLAEAGQLVAAVEAAWKVPSARRLCEAWLDGALALGGEVAARALPKKLSVRPEAFSRVRDELDRICQDATPAGARARTALAQSLLSEPPTAQSRCLARTVARGLVGDSHLGESQRRLAKSVADWSMDPVLAADLPTKHLPAALPESVEVQIGADDVGTLPLRDAVQLPGGRILIALGEAGARLLSRAGGLVAHFDVPAERLVPAENGTAVLALARRGEGWWVTRIDLVTTRATFLWETRFDRCADSFDGSLWFVSAGDAVLALDTLAPTPRALWRVDRIGGPVRALAASGRQMSFLAAPEPADCWTYELPGLVLRSRSFVGSVEEMEAVALSARGAVLVADAGPSGLRLVSTSKGQQTVLRSMTGPFRSLHIGVGVAGEGHAAWAVESEGLLKVELLHDGALCGTISLSAADRPFFRLSDEVLVVGDIRGRLLVFDLETRRIVANLRQ